MPLRGTLKSWNDDRGFGFIAPTGGGRELFVHISAFPRDGSRPAVGDSLTYEIGRGKNGKPQAVHVYRQAPSLQSTHPRIRPPDVTRRRSPLAALIGLALLVVVGAYGYTVYLRQAEHTRPPGVTSERAGEAPVPNQDQYRCDGRTRCAQMTSCSEARFFLNNCPGTQMDGDNDGIPCEQQLCGSLAK